MNTQSITEYRNQLKQIIDDANKEIFKLQARCNHPSETVSHVYDEAHDDINSVYWVSIFCSVCGKHQIHDQYLADWPSYQHTVNPLYTNPAFSD